MTWDQSAVEGALEDRQDLPQFLALCPVIDIKAVLQGLREAVIAGRSFPWPPVLKVCDQLVSGKGIAQVETADCPPPGDEPSSTKSAIACLCLLREALEHDPVPIFMDHREAVWEVLKLLARSPEPSSVNASIHPNSNRLEMAPFAVTTHVKVLYAVISYGIWVVRGLSDSHCGVTASKMNLDVIPEVKQILDANLDPLRHPSIEVREFFGRNLPLLADLDAPWVEQNLSRIFPNDEGTSHLHEAAWRGYILWNCPRQRVLRLLRDLYSLAVDRIQPVAGQNRDDDPDWQLAKHLMIVYWYGEIEAEGEGSLVARFFAKAPDALRAEAIRFLGMILGEEESVPDEVLERLKRLWEIRLEAARDQTNHVKEMSAFGAWFVSEKFDEGWALAQLREILILVGKAELEDQIVERLAKVAPCSPMETVECLGRMAEGFGWDYHVSHWTRHAKTILGTALGDPRSETRRAAVDLIHRLGSHGHLQFRDLLRGSSGP